MEVRKMKRLSLSILFVSLLVVCFSGPAMAAQAIADSYLDLSQLSSANFSWVNLTSSTKAAGNSGSGSFSQGSGPTPGWSAGTSTGSISEAMATGSAINSVYHSSASAGEVGYTNPQSSSWAGIDRMIGLQSATWTWNGGGTQLNPLPVSFTIPYSYSLNLDATNGGDAYAWGSYGVWLNINNGINKLYYVFENYQAKSEGDTTFFTGSGQNMDGSLAYFTFTLTLYNGEQGTADFGSYAKASASAVPIPAAFWLLGSGLVGLIGIRRRKNIIK
jgi:hypothetical protein